MDYLIICLSALLVSALTLFSGFGLGTLLLPAFALFFPVPVAVAATAVVHLANNIFKTFLIGRHANWSVVFRFALPATLAAVGGAALLEVFAGMSELFSYTLFDHVYKVFPLNLVIGLLIIVFAMFDLLPAFTRLAFDQKYLPYGGLLSGFFGGLSGHQGALRAAFLIKCGLSKEAFIGTSTVSTLFVDIARLVVYGIAFYLSSYQAIPGSTGWLVLAATLSAFMGAFIGTRLIRKVTLQTIQWMVGALLVLVGILMSGGLI